MSVLQLKTDRWLAYVAYTYIDATFQSGFVEVVRQQSRGGCQWQSSPFRPGNRLPGIPANQVKLGAYYKVTDKWTVGATAICARAARSCSATRPISRHRCQAISR